MRRRTLLALLVAVLSGRLRRRWRARVPIGRLFRLGDLRRDVHGDLGRHVARQLAAVPLERAFLPVGGRHPPRAGLVLEQWAPLPRRASRTWRKPAASPSCATRCGPRPTRDGRAAASGAQEASFPSPGTATLTFEVEERFPFLTLVSMIAPSPDWFVGVDGIGLQQGGCWVPRVEMDLTGYDAGTDSGATFTAMDADVTPHEPIGPIEALPDDVREAPFATLVLTREAG